MSSNAVIRASSFVEQMMRVAGPLPHDALQPSIQVLGKRKLAEIDLQLLAHTAHALEVGPPKVTGPQQSASVASGQALAGSDFAGMSDDASFRVPSTTRSSESGPGKNGKHRAAEQRRRERINERLAALRELVPHDQRSNTATFLEGVISYIQSLQQSNSVLEAELAAVKAVHGRANEKMVVQPAISGSHVNGLGLDQPVAAVAAARAATGQLLQPNLNTVAGLIAGLGARGSGLTAPSPPLELAAAAAAASSLTAAPGAQSLLAPAQQDLYGMPPAAPVAATSTPAVLKAKQVPASSGTAVVLPPVEPLQVVPATDATAAQGATAGPAAATAPAPLPAAVTAAAPHAAATLQLQLQPTELQGLLEKALLSALQQQAQQLACQLAKPAP
eukprot:GHRR01002784.1.p1 GENE.GHRR01002784.1~~GHRR01002784.1.p1  ORF type:complete len:389 (+),score=137.69 GHRR01002784.1:334-1500(+)